MWKFIYGRFKGKCRVILIPSVLSPLYHPQLITLTTPKFLLWHFSFSFDNNGCGSQSKAGLKKNDEKFCLGLFYHPSTFSSLPSQPPQNAILGIYQSSFMKICVEDYVRKIWRKMKRNHPLTPLPSLLPQNANLGIFYSITKFQIRKMKRNLAL